LAFVLLAMHAVAPVDMAFEMGHAIVSKPGGNRPRFDQTDRDARFGEFQTQGVGKPFERELDRVNKEYKVR
jgi:hypothetical protein